jgi:hypothetical protein
MKHQAATGPAKDFRFLIADFDFGELSRAGFWIRSGMVSQTMARRRLHFAFETERLRVYDAWVLPVPNFHLVERQLFVAFRHDDDCPYPVAFLTWTPETLIGDVVEMVESHPFHQKEGLAKELWLGVEKYLGREIHGDAVSKAGLGLLKSLGEPFRGADATDDEESEDEIGTEDLDDRI